MSSFFSRRRRRQSYSNTSGFPKTAELKTSGVGETPKLSKTAVLLKSVTIVFDTDLGK